ncbi:MAG TPA: antirestriction Ral family protein [Scandinavium sp.]|jgi:hypothetical protein
MSDEIRTLADRWCGQFKVCRGCRLIDECRMRDGEVSLLNPDGTPNLKWKIRMDAMIKRESEKANML